MSLVFDWKKRANAGLALVLIGLAGIAQSFVVLNAQSILRVTSVYLLTIIPFGASIALGGVEMYLAEAIYKRFAMRERKTSKWKKGQHRGLSSVFAKLEMASIVSAFVVLFFSSVFYLAIVAICYGTGIPYYVRFALSEVASVLIVMIASVIIGRIVGGRRYGAFGM